jgi:hypothetical protein
MKITARGWNRNAGTNTICDYPVEKATIGYNYYLSQYTPYLTRNENEVHLQVGPARLTLGGQYLIGVRLTDDDINRLFLEIHPELKTSLGAIFVKPEPVAEAAE